MKSKIKFNVRLAAVLLSAAAFAACDNLNEVDPLHIDGPYDNLVYVNTNTGMNTYPVTEIVKLYPSSGLAKLTFKLPALSTQYAQADIDVSFAVDNAMVEQYNSVNSVKAKALPDEVSVDLGTGKVTIPRGAIISGDSVEMSVTIESTENMELGRYVIPVTVSAVSSAANAGISSTAATVYMPFDLVPNLINGRTSAPSGSAYTTYTSWAVTSTPALTSPANMISTGTSSSTLATAQELTLTVDMASARSNVAGVVFRMGAAANLWSTLEVYNSVDNSTWTYQGTITLGTYSNTYQPVAFRERIPSVRYMKFVVKSWPTATTTFAIRQFIPYW